METLTICRFCLNANVQHVVKDLQLQEIYERLTRIPFQSDMRPLAVCYICYAQLRASLRFKLKCLRAEQLLAQMLDQQPAGDEALNPTQINRSAFYQLSVSSTELTVIESTVHGVRTSDTDKPNTYECYVKLEEQTITDLSDTGRTTHSKPDSEQNPSDLKDNVPLTYVKELRETKETRHTEQQQDRWMTVSPKTEECDSNPVANYKQDNMINVTKTDDVKLEASEHSDDFDNCKTKVNTDQDLITRGMCPQNVRERYSYNIKYNDNAINDRLNGDNTCFSSENIFICDICKKSFSKKIELVTHIMSNCKKSHMCPVCNKGFTQRFSLKMHAFIHTGEKPHVCNVCQKGFIQKTHLKIHKLTHTREKPHVCNVCQKGFNEKAYLKKHKLQHTGEKPYVCNVCQKGFNRKDYLKVHKLTHNKLTHTGKRPHVCNVCQKGFNYKSNLEMHKLTHTSENLHVCNVCQRGFTQKASMKIHKLTHTGEKPHVCNVCQKGFTRKASMKIHKLTHTGEKPHVCNVCQKGFYRKAHLKKHKLLHTGKKLYVCNVCQKSFNHKCWLKIKYYVLKQKGEKPHVCNVCQVYLQCDKKMYIQLHTDVESYDYDVCKQLQAIL